MTEVPDKTATATDRPGSSAQSTIASDRLDASADPANGMPADVVELTVPAASAYVSVLRSTAAALAARLDFTLDEIEDLRIAVDEASAIQLAQAADGTALTCRFLLSGKVLTVSVSAVSTDPRVPPRDSFAWTVLTALAGSVEADIDPASRRTTLTLTKRAEAVDGDVHDLDSTRISRGGTAE